MGNCCSSSSSEPENFGSQGRVLGSGNQSTPSSAPMPQKLTSTSPGRKLGSREGEVAKNDAKSAAALAAEERAHKANKSGGKLATQLANQKKQTQNQLLNAGAEEGRRHQEIDQTTGARNWN